MDVKVTSGTAKAARQKLTPTESKRQSRPSRNKFTEREAALTEELTQALSNILLNEKIRSTWSTRRPAKSIIPANRKITRAPAQLARFTITRNRSQPDPDQDPRNHQLVRKQIRAVEERARS